MPSVFAKPQFVKAAYPHQFAVDLLIPKLVGGTPTDPSVAERWLKEKLGDKDDLLREAVEQVMTERGVTENEAVAAVKADRHLQGFKRDENGLYIEGRQLKSLIKEAAGVRWAGTRWGPTRKGTNSFFAEHVFVTEDRLHLGVEEPSGIAQRFVATFRGTGIRYEEFVTDVKLTASVITDYAFSDEEWALLWLTAEQLGLGASRSQGFGRFEVRGWDQVEP